MRKGLDLKNLQNLINAKTDDAQNNTNTSHILDFARDFESTIIKCKQENKRIGSKYYKPSNIGCIRQYFFMYNDYPEEDSDTPYFLEDIMDSGTDRHIRIQNQVQSMSRFNYDCEWVDVEDYIKEKKLDYLTIVSKTATETKLFDTRYNLSFMCDGVIKYKGIYHILEIKTETQEKWRPQSDVKLDHHSQAICYCLSLQIYSVYYIYENRNICMKKYYDFEVANPMIQELINRIETSNKAIEDNIPPIVNKDEINCDYCRYKKLCQKM